MSEGRGLKQTAVQRVIRIVTSETLSTTPIPQIVVRSCEIDRHLWSAANKRLREFPLPLGEGWCEGLTSSSANTLTLTLSQRRGNRTKAPSPLRSAGAFQITA